MKFFGPPRPERVLLRRNTLYKCVADVRLLIEIPWEIEQLAGGEVAPETNFLQDLVRRVPPRHVHDHQSDGTLGKLHPQGLATMTHRTLFTKLFGSALDDHEDGTPQGPNRQERQCGDRTDQDTDSRFEVSAFDVGPKVPTLVEGRREGMRV